MTSAYVVALIGLCAHTAAAEILHTCEKNGHRTFRSAPCAADETPVGQHDMDPYAGRGPAPVVQVVRPAAQTPPAPAPNSRRKEPTDHEKQLETLHKQLRFQDILDAGRGKAPARTLRQDRQPLRAR